VAVRLMKDELFEAQLLRAIGYAPYGGADAGECLAVAGRIYQVLDPSAHAEPVMPPGGPVGR
jgi:hypothetical protein